MSAYAALCRVLHGGRTLRPSPVAAGAWECATCGAGFRDQVDAGRLLLTEEERRVSVPGLLRVEAEARQAAIGPHPFGVVSMKIVSREPRGEEPEPLPAIVLGRGRRW